MEQIDPVRAQQVWSRVRGTDAPSDPLSRLVALEQEAGLIYAQLAKAPSLAGSRALARLREECRSFERIYTGMMAISEAGRPAPPPRHSLRGNPGGFLRQCWELRRQSLALLEPSRFSPALSPMIPRMKEKNHAHCLLLLELTGWLSSQE